MKRNGWSLVWFGALYCSHWYGWSYRSSMIFIALHSWRTEARRQERKIRARVMHTGAQWRNWRIWFESCSFRLITHYQKVHVTTCKTFVRSNRAFPFVIVKRNIAGETEVSVLYPVSFNLGICNCFRVYLRINLWKLTTWYNVSWPVTPKSQNLSKPLWYYTELFYKSCQP